MRHRGSQTVRDLRLDAAERSEKRARDILLGMNCRLYRIHGWQWRIEGPDGSLLDVFPATRKVSKVSGHPFPFIEVRSWASGLEGVAEACVAAWSSYIISE